MTKNRISILNDVWITNLCTTKEDISIFIVCARDTKYHFVNIKEFIIHINVKRSVGNKHSIYEDFYSNPPLHIPREKRERKFPRAKNKSFMMKFHSDLFKCFQRNLIISMINTKKIIKCFTTTDSSLECLKEMEKNLKFIWCRSHLEKYKRRVKKCVLSKHARVIL